MGWRAAKSRWTSSVVTPDWPANRPMASSTKGVRVKPGWTELTRMFYPFAAASSATDLVIRRTPPLLAE